MTRTGTGMADEATAVSLVLTLFVSGASPRSAMAITAVRDLCEQRMPGRYRLDVVDVYQQPTLVAHENVIATPTLIKQDPVPIHVLVGDMSDTNRLIVALDLDDHSPSPPTQHPGPQHPDT